MASSAFKVKGREYLNLSASFNFVAVFQMITRAALTIFGAILIAVNSIIPAWASNDYTRDQLVDALSNLTKDVLWQCTDDRLGCANLRSAFPVFRKSGNELIAESLVKIFDANYRLYRNVLFYQTDGRYELWGRNWEAYILLEYYAGSVAFPMVLRCQLVAVRKLKCSVSEGQSFENGGGFRNYEITWFR